MDKEICFVAQFPPPLHGLSKAVDTLYNSYLKQKYRFSKINMTNNKRFPINLFHIITSNSDLYYITISQSTGGNIRDLIVIECLFLKKKKIVVHLHGGYYRKMIENESNLLVKKLNKKLFGKMSGAIVLGESLKYIFQGIIEENKIFVVPNCVDNKYLIDEVEFKAKIELANEKETLNVLYLSNFFLSKGYKDLIEVAIILNNKNVSRFKFIFAGEFYSHKEFQEFKDLIQKNKLEKIVQYKGIVNGKEKRDLLKKSDIFILLTRYKREGQPISIIEAMGNGMSIITTQHAGIPDLIKDNENGFFTEYNDYEKIIQVLEKLYTERDLQISVISNNRRKVLDNYMEDHYLNKLDNVFSEVIGENGGFK